MFWTAPNGNCFPQKYLCCTGCTVPSQNRNWWKIGRSSCVCDLSTLLILHMGILVMGTLAASCCISIHIYGYILVAANPRPGDKCPHPISSRSNKYPGICCRKHQKTFHISRRSMKIYDNPWQSMTIYEDLLGVAWTRSFFQNCHDLHRPPRGCPNASSTNCRGCRPEPARHRTNTIAPPWCSQISLASPVPWPRLLAPPELPAAVEMTWFWNVDNVW